MLAGAAEISTLVDHSCSEYGVVPLLIVIVFGHLVVAKYLIVSGAEVNRADNSG